MTRARGIVCAALLAACGGGGDDDGGAIDARAGVDGEGAIDGAGADAAPAVAETEPNNGTSAEDVNTVTFPGGVRGAIDPADDTDVFASELAVGTRWTFRVEAAAAFAPHLIVTNHADEAPVTLALGGAGEAIALEQVILAGGRHNFIVRDARNVPDATGVGGATHTYTLRATPLERAPTTAAIPSTPTGTLASPFAVALYQFNLATETDVRIDVQARRLASASDLDTRASLVRLADQAHLITNDDLDGAQLDSRVEGVLAAGDYLLVIDNVDPAATDLRFAVDFALR